MWHPASGTKQLPVYFTDIFVVAGSEIQNIISSVLCVCRFEIDRSRDTLLLFQEDTSRPAASLSMTDLPTNTILEVANRKSVMWYLRKSFAINTQL